MREQRRTNQIFRNIGIIGEKKEDEICQTKGMISSSHQILTSEDNDSFPDTSSAFSEDSSEIESSDNEPTLPNKVSRQPTSHSPKNLLPKKYSNKFCEGISDDEPTLPNQVSTHPTPHSPNNLLPKKFSKKFSEDSSDTESSDDEPILTCKVATQPTPPSKNNLLTNKNCDRFSLGDESFTKKELETKIKSYLELMASACKEEAFNDLANKFVELLSKKKGA